MCDLKDGGFSTVVRHPHPRLVFVHFVYKTPMVDLSRLRFYVGPYENPVTENGLRFTVRSVRTTHFLLGRMSERKVGTGVYT